jgi:hypothetical protein
MLNESNWSIQLLLEYFKSKVPKDKKNKLVVWKIFRKKVLDEWNIQNLIILEIRGGSWKINSLNYKIEKTKKVLILRLKSIWNRIRR